MFGSGLVAKRKSLVNVWSCMDGDWGQLGRHSSLYPPWGFQRSNLDYQDWQQVYLWAEPSCWPHNFEFFFFQDRLSLCNSPGCPETCFVDQAGPKLTEICASPPPPSLHLIFWNKICTKPGAHWFNETGCSMDCLSLPPMLRLHVCTLPPAFVWMMGTGIRSTFLHNK